MLSRLTSAWWHNSGDGHAAMTRCPKPTACMSNRNYTCDSHFCAPMQTVPPATLAGALRNQRLLFLGDSVTVQLECDLRFALDSVAECWVQPNSYCSEFHGQCTDEFVYPALNISTRMLGVGCPWHCVQHANGTLEKRALQLTTTGVLLSATAVVFSLGNHYEDWRRDAFDASLAQFEAGLRRARLPVAVVSPSATHFATADGSYHGSTSPTASSAAHPHERAECRARAAGAPRPAHSALQDAGLRRLAGRLPRGRYVDVYKLSDDPRQHARWHTSPDGKVAEVGDCRHFCQNCYMLRAWNTVLAQALVSIF
jgi:hypothetical protein